MNAITKTVQGEIVDPVQDTGIALTRQGQGDALKETHAAIYKYLNAGELRTEVSRRSALSGLNSAARVLFELKGETAPDNPAHAVPWTSLNPATYGLLRSAIADRYKPETAKVMIARVRAMIKQAYVLDFITRETEGKIMRELSTKIRGSSEPRRKHVDPGSVRALVEICATDKSPAGARDAAIIGLMVAVAGCRRAEITAMQLSDLDLDAGTVKIKGKGNKERSGDVQNGALRALRAWVQVRGTDPGPLFLAVNKGGNIQPGKLSEQAIYNMLKKRATQAKIADFSPHDLRATFIGELLNADVDLSTVQKIVGHADPKTTATYDRRPREERRAAVAKLHFPF